MSSINQASRRDFIAGAAALAGAGVAGAAVAAGIPQTAVATETTPEPQPIEETYDCDVVVCETLAGRRIGEKAKAVLFATGVF